MYLRRDMHAVASATLARWNHISSSVNDSAGVSGLPISSKSASAPLSPDSVVMGDGSGLRREPADVGRELTSQPISRHRAIPHEADEANTMKP